MQEPTALGAIVMAFGIFITASLQQLPGGMQSTQPLTALLMLTWFGVALRLLQSIRIHGFRAHTDSTAGLFGIGAWVAGSAITARALMLAWPTALWLSRTFLIVSFVLWISFIPFAARSLTRLVRDRRHATNGIVLLAAVATQSVALIALRSLPGWQASHDLALVLIAIGAACYVSGLWPILRRYYAAPNWSLTDDWHNTNCILHGALSISGLTAVVSGAFGADEGLTFWVCVLIIFGAVEIIEVLRLYTRIRHFGWSRAAGTYDVSQWARNFTFGMLYAFTLAFAQHFTIGRGHAWLNSIRSNIVSYGQYFVLFLLMIEIALAARATLLRTRSAAGCT